MRVQGKRTEGAVVLYGERLLRSKLVAGCCLCSCHLDGGLRSCMFVAEDCTVAQLQASCDLYGVGRVGGQ